MSETPRPQDFGIGRLFEHIKDAVVVADAVSERILLWNRGAHDMFGYEEEEALAMPLHRLVGPSLVEPHRAGLARYAESGQGKIVDSGKALEVEAVRKDGSSFIVELTLSSIPDAMPSGARAVMALIRDASDRKAAQSWREAERNQQQALELNDSVVQDLVVAKAHFELGDPDAALAAVDKALRTAQSMVSHLMEERQGLFGLNPGDFVRTRPVSPETDPEG